MTYNLEIQHQFDDVSLSSYASVDHLRLHNLYAGFSIPNIIRLNVDLPLPLSPIIAIVAPIGH